MRAVEISKGIGREGRPREGQAEDLGAMAVVIWDNQLADHAAQCDKSSPSFVPHDDALGAGRVGMEWWILFIVATERPRQEDGNTHGRDGGWLQTTFGLSAGG